MPITAGGVDRRSRGDADFFPKSRGKVSAVPREASRGLGQMTRGPTKRDAPPSAVASACALQRRAKSLLRPVTVAVTVRMARRERHTEPAHELVKSALAALIADLTRASKHISP